MIELFELLGDVDWKKPGGQSVEVLEKVKIRKVGVEIAYPDAGGLTYWVFRYVEGFDLPSDEVGKDLKGVPFTTRRAAKRFLREKLRPWRERYEREKAIVERVLQEGEGEE